MSQTHQFKFISTTGKEGNAPLDIVYPRVLKNLDISIITSLQYKLDTSLSDEEFESFIKFLNLESIPEITVENINDYFKLSQELKFRELEMLVEKFTKEKKESDEIIQKLLSTESGNDTSFLENLISLHLDFYIENHPRLLSSLNLTTLFNIFNSKQRILRNETNALNFLMDVVENGHHDFAILFQSIDFEKIDQSLIQKVVNSDFFNEKSINGLSPKIQNQTIKNLCSFIDETKNDQKEFESKIISHLNEIEEKLNIKIQDSFDKLSSVVDDIQAKFNEFKENLEEKINEMNRNFETQINSIKKEISNLIEKVDSVIENCDNQDEVIQNLSNDMNLIKNIFKLNLTPLDKFRIINDANLVVNNTFNIPIPTTNEEVNNKQGIIANLKSLEKGLNDHKFIAQLSNRDPYNIILPNSDEYYTSSNNGKFFAEIEFDSPKQINGIILKSHNSNYIKGFKILINDEDEVFSTTGINEINKKYGETKISFDLHECKKVKIIQDGKNYKGNNFIRLSRFDVITVDSPDGYFKSIIDNYNNIHLLPICLRFDNFSTESFYLINTKNSVSSYFQNGTDGYFEIQFINGFALVEGYRLKRTSEQEQMKAWVIMGQQKDDGEWINLDQREEESLFSYPPCEVYEMKVKTLVKRIRIVQTQKTWDNTCILRFDHFDVFGKYYFLNQFDH